MIYEGQGFETFGAQRWLSAEDFLRYVGMRDGQCEPPGLRPLEPNESYLRFKFIKPVRKKGTPDMPATRPSDERYDIDRWEVMERLSGGRHIATNGDMDAMVTELWGSKTVEMVVDLTPMAVTEVADHIDDLSFGATQFTLCLSATAQQEAGGVTVTLLHEQGAIVRLAPELATCLDGAGKLMQDGVPLTMTIRDADGEVISRDIEGVNRQSLTEFT